jgi:hypothetical protein
MFDNNNTSGQQGYQFQPGPAPVAQPMPPTPPLPLPPTAEGTPFTPPVPVAPAPVQPVAGDDGLMAIKNDALANLTPLVGQIDQSPEEKFKTTMMLIQASDNASLIKEAYASANQITDPKARAQALIDVINEINYFTQKSDKK